MRRSVLPGLLGGLVMVVWMVVVNGLFGFKASIEMKQISNERKVYQVLKENIIQPGKYVCNPAPTESGTFPPGEPVFAVLNGGMGHGAAGSLALLQLATLLVAPILAAWLLSHASDATRSSYTRKLRFFFGVGVLVAVTSHLPNLGIAGYPLSAALMLSLHDVVLWVMAGFVMAWRVRA